MEPEMKVLQPEIESNEYSNSKGSRSKIKFYHVYVDFHPIP